VLAKVVVDAGGVHGAQFSKPRRAAGAGAASAALPPETKGLAGCKAVNAKSVISGGF